MDKVLYDNYIAILKTELVPALGCTEPIAYATGKVCQVLGRTPERVDIYFSGDILKNVKFHLDLIPPLVFAAVSRPLLLYNAIKLTKNFQK